MLVDVDARLSTVIEVKVLPGLGRAPTRPVRRGVARRQRRVLVFPGRLTPHIDGVGAAGWEPLGRLLAAFAASKEPWVAQTAAAWHAHLRAATPALDETTRWNDLTPGEGFVVALRAWMSWVRQR